MGIKKNVCVCVCVRERERERDRKGRERETERRSQALWLRSGKIKEDILCNFAYIFMRFLFILDTYNVLATGFHQAKPEGFLRFSFISAV